MASVIFMLYAAETWGAAILCAVVFCLAVYPILCLIEKWRGSRIYLLNESPARSKEPVSSFRNAHCDCRTELRALGKPYIAVAAILMLGIGDTAAALVGKKYDTHHIQLKRADPHTSSLHNRLFWCHYSSKFPIPIGVTRNLFYLNFLPISKLSPVSRRFAWRLSAIQSSAADDTFHPV